MDVTESTFIGSVFFLIGLIFFVRTRANISLVHVGGGDRSSSKEIVSREIKSRDTLSHEIQYLE